MHQWEVPLCLDSYCLAHALRGLDAQFRTSAPWVFGVLATVAMVVLLVWPW